MGKQKIVIIIVVLFVTVSGIFYSVSYGKREEAVFVTEEISVEDDINVNSGFFETSLEENFSDNFDKEAFLNKQEKEKQNVETSSDKLEEGLEEKLNLETVTQEKNATNEKEEVIYVHICGQVTSSGVYCLNKESRVNDLVKMAGGFTNEASTDYVNLAQKLVDGQQIYIPSKEEVLEMDLSSKIDVSIEKSEEKETIPNKVNINTADKSQLMTLTGIGEAKAEAIIQYREESGGFRSIEELKQIEGIKDGVFNKIKDKIIVG